VGAPTACVASPEQVVAWNETFMAKPAWMPDWQYKQVRELMMLERGEIQPFYYQLVPEFLIKRVVERMKKTNPDVSQAE
jgi:hypothetical protein